MDQSSNVVHLALWDCGYQGAVVIEDKELADAVRKNFRKIRDEENESGSSYDDE